MNRIIRVSVLSLLAVLLTSCFIDGEITGFGVLFFIVLAAFIIALIVMFIKSQEAEEKKRQIRENWRIRRLEEEANKAREQELKQSQYDEANLELLSTMGEPDKTIVLGETDINKEIRVYSDKRKVNILGKDYDFSSILSCHCTDDSHVVKGQTTITTTGTSKTDNGNMLGRAVVGGLVAGGAGAIIGGSTAKQNTTSTSVVNQGKDITRHNYTVWISVKDIVNPMIQIPIGKDEAKANEIVALMTAIISFKDGGDAQPNPEAIAQKKEPSLAAKKSSAPKVFHRGQLVVIKEDESQFEIDDIDLRGGEPLYYCDELNRYFTAEELEDAQTYWDNKK